MSITSMLSSTYGIDSTAGTKTTCPFCSKATLQIHHNNSFAKCFHPACGKLLTLSNNSPLYNIANTLYNDFISHFNENCSAYQYLKARHISDEIIKFHKIGSVPKDYDLSKICNSELNIINELPRKTITQKKYAQSHYDIITSFMGKYNKLLQSCENFLVFFYTDHNGIITKIKLRQPYTKNFKSIKITDNNGVFGWNESSTKNTNLIVYEGEFNLLRYQSICGISTNSIAVGSSTDVDYTTIEKCGSSFTLFYDNDENKAGESLFNNWKSYHSVKICTTPDTNSDLDSFVSAGADTCTINSIINNAQPFHEPLSSVKSKIIALREALNSGGKNIVEFQIYDQISELITNHLKSLGKFLNVDSEPVFLPTSAVEPITLDKTNPHLAILFSDYGLIPTEKVWKYSLEAIRIHCVKFGDYPQTASLAHFDEPTKTLRVNLFCGKYAKITSSSFSIRNNASESIFFYFNKAWQPVDYTQLNLDSVENMGTMDALIFNRINFDPDDTLSINERKMLFKAWVLSMFFPQLMYTKPLLTFIGQKGSGKSSAGRQLGKMLFGSKFEVTGLPEDSKDFEGSALTSPFIVIDNADSYRKWLNDSLALLSTNGVFKRRILYTTSQYAEIPISTFAILTARTPKFTRDDVADRCIVLNLERLSGKFIPEAVLIHDIDSNRTSLWNDLLMHCKYILKAMDSCVTTDTTTVRMADFAKFTKLYSHAFGGDLYKTFENLENAQLEFSLSNDWLLELLITTSVKYANETLSASELLTKLKECDESHALFSKFTPKTIISSLNANKEAYSKHVSIEMKRWSNRQWAIKLTPLQQPQSAEFSY